MDRWALVTGASAGIGAEFARQLAERGASLVITARRLDRLEALAAELREKYGVRVECIAADLAQTNAVDEICAEIDRRGIRVDILINNAGYGVAGSFLTPSWQTHADPSSVLMTAPCELAYKLLPGMRERGYGRIANIASLAGHMPGSAGHTLYAASKAFLIKFSQSLALENIAKGVKVCAICPGFTYSEFHDVVGTREDRVEDAEMDVVACVGRGARRDRCDGARRDRLRDRTHQPADQVADEDRARQNGVALHPETIEQIPQAPTRST